MTDAELLMDVCLSTFPNARFTLIFKMTAGGLGRDELAIASQDTEVVDR